jgi:hypothetical protein
MHKGATINQSDIIIVSGLPRSGTSMLMQILESGGIPVLADHIRKPDDDNPNGYYEFEPVKRTRDDPSWVPAARGKAVKVIYRLVYNLPGGYDYRVLFLHRKIDEILASQKIMLRRHQKKGSKLDSFKLGVYFERQLKTCKAWIRGKRNFSILPIQYKDMVHSPLSECRKIGSFLGNTFDVSRAASAVDRNLYRNRL